MRHQKQLKYIAGFAALLATACSPAPPSFTQEAQPIANEDNIVIEHVPPQNQAYQKLHQSLQQSQEFVAIASDLNTQFSLPQRLSVYFQECGDPNGADSPTEGKIEICYEWLQTYINIRSGESSSTEEFEATAINAALLPFFHKLGHVFIQQYQLTIAGNEENAADAFAALMLSDLKEKEALSLTTEQFDIDASEQEELKQLPFWKTHGFDAQRYANIACIIDSHPTHIPLIQRVQK